MNCKWQSISRKALMFDTNKVQKSIFRWELQLCYPLLDIIQHVSFSKIFTKFLKLNRSYLIGFSQKYTAATTPWPTSVYKLSCEYETASQDWAGAGLHDSLRLSFPCNLLGALQQRVVDVLGAGDLRLDHVEVLRVRHGLCLDRVGLGGCRHQVGRVLGAVDALREALVRQSLREKKTNTQRHFICTCGIHY